MYIEILRVRQWYKNVTVILGALFAGITFNVLPEVAFVLLLACLVSSANYVMNEIADLKHDKLHPKKKNRALASGILNIKQAYTLLLILVLYILICSLFVNAKSTWMLIALFGAAILYNIKPIRLKDIPFIDVISESVNNPIRFLIGWYVITPVAPSPMLLLLVWTTGALLMTRKRLEELRQYRSFAREYRKVFKHYTTKSLKNATIMYVILSFVFCLQWIFIQ